MNQDDPRLEEATKELYTLEFNTGKMLDIAGDYAGLPVKQAKENVKNDLIKLNLASKLYEIMNSPVMCRWGAECIIKMFDLIAKIKQLDIKSINNLELRKFI